MIIFILFIIGKHDAFLASIDVHCKVTMSTMAAASALACCCAGMPFIMQRVSAKGWIFLAAHGTIVEKVLSPQEEIVVDSNS